MALKRIRKGKTVILRWTIKTNNQDLPLDGRDLTLQITGPYLFCKNIPFSIEDDGNTLYATVQGSYITMSGTYIVSLWENYGNKNQSVVDTDAFEVVDRTNQES